MFGNGIFATDGQNWVFQRKVAAKVFTTKAFKNIFETVFMDNISVLRSTPFGSAALNCCSLPPESLAGNESRGGAGGREPAEVTGLAAELPSIRRAF